MERLRILSLLVVCAGCRQGAVSMAEGELLVNPSSVNFGSTWLGHRATAKLSLQNTARSGIDVTLTPEDPFDAPGSVHLGGGEQLEVELGVTGTALGLVTGNLFVSANGTTQRVPLRAEVAAPPDCPARDCRVVTFNPLTGACDETLEADGSTCGANNVCIFEGTCSAGTCLGRARDCGDGDACTMDACDRTAGCVHETVTCPASERVCEVAVCSPQTGCGFAPAGDGASCGANDCVTAQVCITGQCVARPAPDGSQCAAATSCRAPGVCHGQQCALPAPTELQPSWRYSPPTGVTLAFLGAVDDLGNLYATESGPFVRNADGNAASPGIAFEDRSAIPIPTNLISLTPAGVLRFRVQVTTDCPNCVSGLWFSVDSAGHRVFVNAKGTTSAFNSDSGNLLWSTVPTNGLPSYDLKPDGGASFSTSPPMLLGADDVGVPVIEGLSDHHAYVQVFDRTNGAFRWQFHRKGHLYGTGVSSDGELWTSSANCWAPAGEMARLDGAGQQQAVKFVPWIPSIYGEGVAIGSSNGRLQLMNQVLNLTSDLTTMTGVGSWAQPLLSGQQLVLFDGNARSLHSVDLTTGMHAFTFNGVQGTALEFELLNGGGVAWTGQLPDAGVLGAVNARGEEVLQCPLATSVESATAIIRGRAYVQTGGDLVAYDVRGLDVAPRGWVTRHGSLQRGFGAR